MYIDERGQINRWDRVNTSPRGQRRRPERPADPPPPRPGFIRGLFRAIIGLIKLLLKLGISPVAGALIAAAAAAGLNHFEIARIDDGSPILGLMILFFTIWVWRFLSRVGPLKRRRT